MIGQMVMKAVLRSGLRSGTAVSINRQAVLVYLRERQNGLPGTSYRSNRYRVSVCSRTTLADCLRLHCRSELVSKCL